MSFIDRLFSSKTHRKTYKVNQPSRRIEKSAENAEDLMPEDIDDFLAELGQEVGHFARNLDAHVQRIRKAEPLLESFLDQYLGDEQILIIATAAAEKMRLTQSDGEEHSFALAQPPVCYQICTLPVEMGQAKNWFVRRYEGYTKLLESSWNSPYFQGSGCTVFCHIIYGLTREKACWVHMAICPVGQPAPVSKMMVPIEFLTLEERRTSGL